MNQYRLEEIHDDGGGDVAEVTAKVFAESAERALQIGRDNNIYPQKIVPVEEESFLITASRKIYERR